VTLPPSGIYREPSSSGQKGLVFSRTRIVLNCVAVEVMRSTPYRLGQGEFDWSGSTLDAEFALPGEPVLGLINSYGFAEDTPQLTGRLRAFRTEDSDRAEHPYFIDDTLTLDVQLGPTAFSWLWGQMITRNGWLDVNVDFPGLELETDQDPRGLTARSFVEVTQTGETESTRVNLTLNVRDRWSAP
jgi:hypothetical protein